jgi:hypothetical protein
MTETILDEIVFLLKREGREESEITLIRYRPLDVKGNPLPSCWHLSCVCRRVGLIDEDQYFGRVSIQCQCGFHETINFSRIIKETI